MRSRLRNCRTGITGRRAHRDVSHYVRRSALGREASAPHRSTSRACQIPYVSDRTGHRAQP
jgi:hypothetical protein